MTDQAAQPLTARQHLALAERLAASKHWGEAEGHYLQALDGNESEVAAAAAFRLARRAEQANDWKTARTLYHRAMRDGADDVRTRAAFFLGALHLVEGDNSGARDILLVASESKEDLIRPWAMLRLGDACYRQEDYIGAYHAYNAAFATGNVQAQRWAASQLSYVEALLKRSDQERAGS